jgi:hypothetical protein
VCGFGRLRIGDEIRDGSARDRCRSHPPGPRPGAGNGQMDVRRRHHPPSSSTDISVRTGFSVLAAIHFRNIGC